MDNTSDPETYAIIGAAMAVHSELGCGFLERVYQEALAIEMTTNNIPFQMEAAVPIQYKGHSLEASYRADFICYSNVVVELKALDVLSKAHLGQVIHYLRATGNTKGLPLNFGTDKLEYKRIIHTH